MSDIDYEKRASRYDNLGITVCALLPPDRGCAMSEYESIPSTCLSDIESRIERPRCPRCHEPRMRHSKTEAGPAGFEYRTFDCQKCNRTHTMIIASDPIDSNVRGWRPAS